MIPNDWQRQLYPSAYDTALAELIHGTSDKPVPPSPTIVRYEVLKMVREMGAEDWSQVLETAPKSADFSAFEAECIHWQWQEKTWIQEGIPGYLQIGAAAALTVGLLSHFQLKRGMILV